MWPVTKNLKSSLNFLLASSFLMQMLVGTVGIAVPIYATEMGASPLLLGIIGATGGLIYSFMPLVSGFFSDKFRRKPFIFASMLLYSSSCILYTLAENPHMFIPIKALEWISVALFWPSTEALLTEVSEGKLEEALKKFNLSWGSGIIIGPMIGGSLISALGIKAKAPFYVSSAISLALSLLTIVIVREMLENKPARKYESSEPSKSTLISISTAVISILLLYSITGIVISLFPAYATSLGIQAYEVGIIMLLNGLFRLIAFFEAYRIKSKVGANRMFLSGSLTLAIASALIAISSTTFMFSIALSALGFGAGILYAASIARILGGRESARGYAAGLFESLIGAGYFLGSLAGGFVAEYALNFPYILGALMSLAVALFQILIKRKE